MGKDRGAQERGRVAEDTGRRQQHAYMRIHTAQSVAAVRHGYCSAAAAAAAAAAAEAAGSVITAAGQA